MNRIRMRIQRMTLGMMPPNRNRLAWAGLLLALTLTTTGCLLLAAGAAGGAAAGTVAYVKGELEGRLDASMDEAEAAAEKAIDDLGFHYLRTEGDATQTKLFARTTDDKKVQIQLRPISKQNTEIGIRIGIFGDEQRSLKILNTIQSHLDGNNGSEQGSESPSPAESRPQDI